MIRSLAAAALLSASALAGPPDAKEIAGLIERMRDEDPEVRVAAREALRDAGESAIPALEKAAEEQGPRAAQARAVLRQIEFDRRAAKAIGAGVSWYRWERAGAGAAWIRLEARRRDGKDRGWTLVETIFMDGVTLTQKSETDREFALQAISSTLTSGADKSVVSAVIRDGECVLEEAGKKHTMPAPGLPMTDWAVLRFAPALLANPPPETEMVVWDSPESEPATTTLEIGELQFVEGPSGSVRAIPVKVEGLMTVFVKEDGSVSHAARGAGSFITAAEEKDGPEKFRK
jgi:hypothetical protein